MAWRKHFYGDQSAICNRSTPHGFNKVKQLWVSFSLLLIHLFADEGLDTVAADEHIAGCMAAVQEGKFD
jgi:hypothetical protein